MSVKVPLDTDSGLYFERALLSTTTVPRSDMGAASWAISVVAADAAARMKMDLEFIA